MTRKRGRPPAGIAERQSAEQIRESGATSFGRVFRFYVDNLGIEQTTLARDTGISRQEISTWYGGKKRPPGWLDAGTLAAAVYMEVLKQKRSGARLHKDIKPDAAAIMQDFLNHAGYRITDARDKELIWSRLQSKVRNQDDEPAPALRVGYFLWGNFAKRDRAGSFVGLSAELCTRLCALLGVRIEPIQISLTDVAEKLDNHEVDLVAPLIQLPARALEFACSKPIRDLRAGLALLAPRSAESLFSALVVNSSWTNIPWNRLQVFVVREGLADVLLSSLGGPANVERSESFQEAIDAVQNHRADAQLVRTFAADEVSCGAVEDKTFKIVHRRPLKLPVAFGLHSAETHLLAAVNLCVETINSDISHAKFAHYENDPQAAGFPKPPKKPIE